MEINTTINNGKTWFIYSTYIHISLIHIYSHSHHICFIHIYHIYTHKKFISNEFNFANYAFTDHSIHFINTTIPNANQYVTQTMHNQQLQPTKTDNNSNVNQPCICIWYHWSKLPTLSISSNYEA